MQALAARTEAKPIAVMGKAIKFSPTRKVVLIPSYRDLSASIVSQRWYTRPDFKIFAETEIERRRSHGISSMSALCSRAEEVPDDDDAPPCELPSERLAAATKIVGFGALVAGCVVPVVLSAGLLAGALDVPRFLWATFGGLAIVFSPVVLVVVHIARNLLRSLHEPDDKYDAAALLARAGPTAARRANAHTARGVGGAATKAATKATTETRPTRTRSSRPPFRSAAAAGCRCASRAVCLFRLLHALAAWADAYPRMPRHCAAERADVPARARAAARADAPRILCVTAESKLRRVPNCA